MRYDLPLTWSPSSAVIVRRLLGTTDFGRCPQHVPVSFWYDVVLEFDSYDCMFMHENGDAASMSMSAGMQHHIPHRRL